MPTPTRPTHPFDLILARDDIAGLKGRLVLDTSIISTHRSKLVDVARVTRIKLAWVTGIELARVTRISCSGGARSAGSVVAEST